MGCRDWRDRAPLTADRGAGRTAVRLELRPCGRDALLIIGGGRAHAGAVALSHHGGLSGDGPGTGLLLTPGHKEGPLARTAAERLAAAAGCVCVVVAGIHQDDATPGEIASIMANVDAAVSELVERVRSA